MPRLPGFIQPHGALVALDTQGTMTHRSISRLKGLRPLEDFLAETVSMVRELTGSDRVMAYRFMHDGRGRCRVACLGCAGGDGASTDAAVGLSMWLDASRGPSAVALHALSRVPEPLRLALAPLTGLMAMCFDPARHGGIVLLRRSRSRPSPAAGQLGSRWSKDGRCRAT